MAAPTNIGFHNVKANNNLLYASIVANLALGQRAAAYEFFTLIKGWSETPILCTASQLPGMEHATGEVTGQFGMKTLVHGARINSGEMTFTFGETITGIMLGHLKTSISEKKYEEILIYPAPESLGGLPMPNGAFLLQLCKLKLETVDLDTSDNAGLINLTVIAEYSWCDYNPVPALRTLG